MRKIAVLLLLLAGFAFADNFNSGTTPPAKCAIGTTWLDTDAMVGRRVLVCSVADTWTVTNLLFTAPQAMPDAAATGVFTVDLPTQDTYCATHVSFMYGATNGTDTVSHMGIMVCAFTNDDGTVTGTCADSAEAVNGTGCGAGCDAFTVTVVGTVATAKMNFNNTLSVTGAVQLGLVNNTCASLTVIP